jgi:hypothetical protein
MRPAPAQPHDYLLAPLKLHGENMAGLLARVNRQD